jgi:hypothetical protein
VNRWIDKTRKHLNAIMTKERVFTEHFSIEHEFHGIHSSRITESFTIRPVSKLGWQVFTDGIQTHNVTLHLKSDIHIQPEVIRVHTQVHDPKESNQVVKQVKQIILHHLKEYQHRLNKDPKVKYVQKFCQRCVYYETKPLNQCMRHCQFTPKPPEE